MVVLLLILSIMCLSMAGLSYLIGPERIDKETRRRWRRWLLVYADMAIVLALLALMLRIVELS